MQVIQMVNVSIQILLLIINFQKGNFYLSLSFHTIDQQVLNSSFLQLLLEQLSYAIIAFMTHNNINLDRFLEAFESYNSCNFLTN